MSTGASWEIKLDNPSGQQLLEIRKPVSFACSLATNTPGGFSMVLPQGFDKSLLSLDSIIEFSRTPPGGRKDLVQVYFVRSFRYFDDQNGTEYLEIGGFDPLYLLTSRIIAYKSDTAQALMTDFTDDMSKAVVIDNLGGDAIAARDLSGYGFSVEADFGGGISVTKQFSYENLLDVVRGIAETSRGNGTELYYGVKAIPGNDGLFDFRFWAHAAQYGVNRTSTSPSPVYFGKNWGNLQVPEYIIDYSDEINYVYAGGSGKGTARTVREVSTTSAINASQWNRREGFTQNTTAESSAAALDAAGYDYLNKHRVVRKFSGTLLDTPRYRYGIDWGFGDRVTCEYQGMQFDALINLVQFSIDGNGQETITAQVKVDE